MSLELAYLSRLASNFDLLILASQVARITGVPAQLFFFFFLFNTEEFFCYNFFF
jgi:hypothetical protein